MLKFVFNMFAALQIFQAKDAFSCHITMLVASVALLSAPLPGLAVVFPDTAAAPDVAGECLLRMFNQSTPRERKVCNCNQFQGEAG
jgi:hypothetical protein